MFSHICRACLVPLKEPQIVPLFQPYNNIYYLPSIICGTMQISPEYHDNLGRNICRKCADTIMKIHEFRSMYLESDTKLRTMLSRKEPNDERQSVMDAPNFYAMSIGGNGGGEHDGSASSGSVSQQHWKWKTRQELQQNERLHRPSQMHSNLESATATAIATTTAAAASANSAERNHSDDDGDYAQIVNVDPSVLADIIGDDKMNSNSMSRWACKQCPGPRTFQKRSDLREHNRTHASIKMQSHGPNQSQQSGNGDQPLMELQPDVELEPAEAMLLLSSLGASSMEHGKSDGVAGASTTSSSVHSHSQSDPQRWKCKQCLHIFSKRDFLRAHKREYPKNSCKLSATIDASQLHSNNKQIPFKMPGINYRIDGRYSEITHDGQRRFKNGVKTESGENRWECTLCEKVFATRKELREHRRDGHKKEDRLRMAASKAKQLPRGEKRWVCRHCGQSFLTRTMMRHHSRTEHAVASNSLSMIYSTSTSNTNTNESTICTYCGQRCANKEQLQLHMRQHVQLHGDTKTYLCTICNQLFIDKYHLSTHIEQHPAIPPPYTCKRCRKTFLDSNILKEHVKSEHLTARKFVCNICTKDFSRSGSLKSHIMTHRDEERHFYLQHMHQQQQQPQQQQHHHHQQPQHQHQQPMPGFVIMSGNAGHLP